MTKNTGAGSPIAAVERDTGIGKDTLRVWERRYGFPKPLRDERGDRLYPPAQVRSLRLIRRLMDIGHRPSRLVGISDRKLNAMLAPVPTDTRQTKVAAGDAAAPRRGPGRPRKHAVEAVAVVDLAAAARDEQAQRLLALLRAHDLTELRALLSQALARDGLDRFVRQTLAGMNAAVGRAWSEGSLAVFEEHLYSEQVKALLRQAIAALPPPGAGARVLLTTVPDEQHGLGLLMIEALCALHGMPCVALGTQTPTDEIAAAALAHRVQAVLLSFSAAFPRRQLPTLLAGLRQRLPEGIQLWAGGAGVRRAAPLAGIAYGHSLDDALDLLKALRAG